MLVRSVLRIALLAVLAFIPGFASASSSLQVEKAERDGDLEPGFPAQAWEGNGGSYRVGAAIHTLIGNVDANSRLEIIATGIPFGPLYVWNADGSASIQGSEGRAWRGSVPSIRAAFANNSWA